MLNEKKLTAAELTSRENIIMGMKKNKSQLVKKFGKDAEKVMYGRATNIAKKQAEASKQPEEMKEDKLRKMIQDVLSKPLDEKKKSFNESLTPEEEIELDNIEDIIRYKGNSYGTSGSTSMKERYAELKSKMIKQDNLDEDLDLGHEDNEPHMIKAELARIGKYAMELYKMVDQFEGPQEVDFPAWWQSKITTASNMISSAKHYLEFELEEPKIDAMVNVASQEGAIGEEMTPQKSKKIGMSFEGIDEAMVTTLAEKIMKRLKSNI